MPISPLVGKPAPSELLIDQMGAWLTAVVADTSKRSRAAKVVANKPADVVDACWTTAGVKIIAPQVLFDPTGTNLCNTLFPRGVVTTDSVSLTCAPRWASNFLGRTTPAELPFLVILSVAFIQK